MTAIPILLASLFPLEMRIYDTSNMRPILNQSELLIVDNPDRGIFLQVAWFLPDDLSVIVDVQEDLLESAKQWLPLLEEGGLYISDTSKPGTRIGQRRLVETLVNAGYEVEPLPEGISSKATKFDAFRVRPNGTQQ